MRKIAQTASYMYTRSHNRIFFARNLRSEPTFLNVMIVADKEINQSFPLRKFSRGTRIINNVKQII